MKNYSIISTKAKGTRSGRNRINANSASGNSGDYYFVSKSVSLSDVWDIISVVFGKCGH